SERIRVRRGERRAGTVFANGLLGVLCVLCVRLEMQEQVSYIVFGPDRQPSGGGRDSTSTSSGSSSSNSRSSSRGSNRSRNSSRSSSNSRPAQIATFLSWPDGQRASCRHKVQV